MEIAISQELNRAKSMKKVVDYLYSISASYAKKRKIETQLAACMMFEKNFTPDHFFPHKVSKEGLLMFNMSVPNIDVSHLENLFDEARNQKVETTIASMKIFFKKDKVYFVIDKHRISPIHIHIYKKMCCDLKRNGIQKEQWNTHIALVLSRYLLTLKGESHQLGIPYYQELNQFEQIKAELFASPLNHTLDRFCSVYPDTDKPFGSLGSVFDFVRSDQFEEGLYIANPPYHPRTMDMFMEMILQRMKQVKCSILITCPVWDYDGLCELGIKEFADKYYKDVPYEMFEMAKKSEFYRFHILHPRDLHLYIDHKTQTKVSVVGTYSIFLSSRNVEYEKNLYNFLSSHKK